jgi:predicted RND superfamily exporter protein
VSVTLLFLSVFPRIKTDTDPVKMLPQDNSAVVLYNNVKETFNIHDYVVLGIESKDDKSLFTVDGLTKISAITNELLKEISEEVVVKEDVISLNKIDDIIKNESGELLVQPLMKSPPSNESEARSILDKLNANPMLGGKIASKDGSLVGIFVPLQKGQKEQSYMLGQTMLKVANKYLGPNENVYLGGLPVAESTFGNEMFMQMALYAPLAGLVIFLLLLFFFRSVKLVIAPMALGMMVVIWAMGALILSGNVVHIMSSMIPIFLLPIAVLNSIHILSKLNDKIRKHKNRSDAVRDVMSGLFNAMLYTSLTTVIGFASLISTGIPPVAVFGVFIALGVFMSWLLSMIFIPSYVMLLRYEDLKNLGEGSNKSFLVKIVYIFKNISVNRPLTVVLTSAAILVISYIGIN